jgi:hypothetical protein
MKKRFICILVLLVFLSAWTTPVEAETGSSVGFDAEALDAYIFGQMEKHGIQGISIAVTSKRKLSISKATVRQAMVVR